MQGSLLGPPEPLLEEEPEPMPPIEDVMADRSFSPYELQILGFPISARRLRKSKGA